MREEKSLLLLYLVGLGKIQLACGKSLGKSHLGFKGKIFEGNSKIVKCFLFTWLSFLSCGTETVRDFITVSFSLFPLGKKKKKTPHTRTKYSVHLKTKCS